MSSVSSSTASPTISVGSDGSVTASNLVNNLDPTAIVTALMQAAAIPQSQLEARIKTEQSSVADYQSLNVSLQSLATSATSDAAAQGLNLMTATSSSTAVTATTDTSASATSFQLTVDQLAQAQVSVSGTMSSWPDSTGAITIVNSAGQSTTVTAASSGLDDVAKAINSAGAGVTASEVQVGTDSSGNPTYRLQLTSNQTGANGTFQIYAGTGAQVTAGTATNILTQSGAATVQQAQNAQVTLWPGTAAAQTISSSTNTFDNLEQGITVQVSQTSQSPITLTTTTDSTDIANAASSLVSAVNTIMSYIQQQSSGTTTTSANGSTSVTAGPFTGDPTTRGIANQLMTALSNPVGAQGNVSPSTYGISIQSDGSIQFDQSAFEAALASDPQDTIAALQTMAGRVQQVATTASDPISGTITAAIQSQNTQIGNDQASDANWTTVLAQKKTMLTAEYSNLVSTLSQLQSEQSYLTQQIQIMNNQNNH